MSDIDMMRNAVRDGFTKTLADLETMVAIPSVSMSSDNEAAMQSSAEAVAALIRELGWDDVRIVSVPGGRPAVLAHYPAPEGKPTVCLYAHHDVQPTGPLDAWTSAPFETHTRDGRLYGRGVVDDKGGIAVHLAALRALRGKPPVGVTLFIEGEEEIGSPTMPQFLDVYGADLASDAFVICDSGNWEVGRPALTTSLRGLIDVVLEVRTLDHPLHSGVFGGAVPDALTTLCRIIGALWDDCGVVTVPGLTRDEPSSLDYPVERLRAESGILDGVEFIGEGPLADRVWTQPAITVTGIDAPSVETASNALYPTARAKLSLRIAPSQDADEALEKLKQHILTTAPFGAHISFGESTAGSGTLIDAKNPIARTALTAIADSFEVEPVEMGMGGSIPLAYALQNRYPQASVLLTGICDPHSRMHGNDESVDLSDFENMAVAEALLLNRLGA